MLRAEAATDNETNRQQAAAAKKNRAPRESATALLHWYDQNRRDLPWRAEPGAKPDPYRVWLSEIMLQQTTAATVAPYYRRFLARFPDVFALASTNRDTVLAAWQGLGYYARARNLHACARVIASEFGGKFPDSEAELRRLPGIGPYSAAAIAAIAFDRQASAVDGNVERVIARLFAVDTPLPAAKPEIRRLAASLVPPERPGDYAQAVMDLGAGVCTPRNPSCGICPWRGICRARALGIAGTLPRRAPKPARPRRHAVAFVLTRADGAVLLRQRAETGLLGGMMEVPTTPWRAKRWGMAEAAAHAPGRGRWRRVPGLVAHAFTHFRFEVAVMTRECRELRPKDGRWVRPKDLARVALPTVMKKIVRHAGGAAPKHGKAGKGSPPQRGARRAGHRLGGN